MNVRGHELSARHLVGAIVFTAGAVLFGSGINQALPNRAVLCAEAEQGDCDAVYSEDTKIDLYAAGHELVGGTVLMLSGVAVGTGFIGSRSGRREF